LSGTVVLSLISRILSAQDKANQTEAVSLRLDETASSWNDAVFNERLHGISHYWKRHRYARAFWLGGQTLKTAERQYGPFDLRTAKIILTLARIRSSDGHLKASEDLYGRALAIFRREKNPGALAGTLDELASLKEKEGQYPSAESLLQESLAIDRKTLKPDDADLWLGINHLANLYEMQHQYSKAAPLLKELVAFYEKTGHPMLENMKERYAFARKKS